VEKLEWKNWNGKAGMANKPPPWRATPRPLAGVLGGLDGRLRRRWLWSWSW